MKIKKIGNIELTNTIWWSNYDKHVKIQSEVEETINGGVIVWEQPYKATSEVIVLEDSQNGWQTKDVKDAIKNLCDNSLGTTTTITTMEGVAIPVRFRHEVGAACEFSRVVGSYACDYYTCKINLAKVN